MLLLPFIRFHGVYNVVVFQWSQRRLVRFEGAVALIGSFNLKHGVVEHVHLSQLELLDIGDRSLMLEGGLGPCHLLFRKMLIRLH